MITIDDIASLLDGNDSRKALKEATRAVNDDPDNADLLYGLAGTFLDHDDAAGACAVLAKAIERHRDDPRLLQRYGVALFAITDVDAAREMLEQALSRWPASHATERAQCLTVIGQVLVCDNDFEGAQEKWKEALAIDPTCVDAAAALDASGDPMETHVEQRNAYPEYQEFLARELEKGREAGVIDDHTSEDVIQEIRRVLGAIFDDQISRVPGSVYDEETHLMRRATYEDLTEDERFESARAIDVDWEDIASVLERFRERSEEHAVQSEERNSTATGADVNTMIATYDYGFLATGNMRYALLARAALEATGLTAERIDRIVRHGDASAEEEEIFQWAASIGRAMEEWVRSGQSIDGSASYGLAEEYVRNRVEIDHVVASILSAVRAAVEHEMR